MRRFWAIKHPHLDLFLSRGPVTSGGMQRWEKDERDAKQFPSEAVGAGRDRPHPQRPRHRGRVHGAGMSFDHPILDWLFVAILFLCMVGALASIIGGFALAVTILVWGFA
jgi:hypothetical protein